MVAENTNGTDQNKWTWSVDVGPVEEIPVEIPVAPGTLVNTVYLRSQIINGSDITNNDMGYVGTTGNGILEINASNFAGFYYDLNNNIGAEKFEILQNSTVSDRTINKSGLVYTTSIINTNYEQILWTDLYQKICYFGDEYVPIKTNSANKLSKILIDEKNSHTIRSGQSFELGEGYAITPQQIDVNGDKVWLELTKDGLYVNDKIISVSGTNTIADKTWVYKQDIDSETDVETFRIYVDQVFQGQVDSLMVVKGIWQISDSILELDTNTTAGLMKVQEIDSKIQMINNESMTLNRGSTVDIANNIYIVVADSTTGIRFHFSKKHTTPGTYEIRGEAYNLSSGISEIIDYSNFAGFYYNLNTNLGTESLEINSISDRIINADSLIYTTVPKVTEFEYAPWGSYNVTGFMGEKYFTGYPSGSFGTTSAISLISNGQLSKILIDEDKSRSIYSGAGLILEGGYVLNIVEVDKNGDKVFVNLTKGGTVLDSSIITSNSDYIYNKDLGSSADVPIIAVHFKDIFQGTETSAVFVDGIFQISDQYKTVSNGDIYGKMKVTTIDANKIEMKNANSITLTKDSIISIMDKFKFKVADDSNNVRFYPFIEMVIEATVKEPVDETMSSVYNGSITEGDGYQINNYVIDVTDIFVTDKLAVFKVYDTGNLKHDKMIGINESLSFDFEGSTVKLKLQSIGSGVLPRASVLIETNYSISDLHTNQIVNGGHEYATYTGDFYTMQLQRGWNLVSTPLTPDTPNVNTLFDSNSDVILPIYSWNTANKQYYDVSTIEISKGYWILALNDTQVTFAGTPYGG
ncbi:MAG: S-layer protein domain-containing protein [Methanosarcinaceae archaeon]|nr:S-layer protein domain-containing protein [Methanosarcinaceae archaeon]